MLRASDIGRLAIGAMLLAVGFIWLAFSTGGPPQLSVLPGVEIAATGR